MPQVAEHTRGGSRRDVARFLTAHEPCASDFQIRRFSESGGGGLNVICNGCGERAMYELGEPGRLKPVGSAVVEDFPGERHVTRREIERWLPAPAALPWWVPNAYIVAVILAGLAMIAVGVLQDRNGDHLFQGGGSGTQSTQPESAQPPVAAQTGAGTATSNEPKKEPDRGRSQSTSAELDRVTVLSRFTIGLPSGWSGGMSGGAVVFRPSDGDAELRVFLESGAQRTSELSREARKFLEEEHPGARMIGVERLRLGGDPAARVGVRYRGGKAWATVLSESGYSYLLLSRIGGGASGPLKRQAEAALASFHAL